MTTNHSKRTYPMAGIYLHIPFCKTRCIYCDFCSTTRDDLRKAYIGALCTELRQRHDYLQGQPPATVYLGGGTPSRLDRDDLHRLFCTLDDVFGLSACTEITLEANPDDLTPAYIAMLHDSLPINRISMGVQTFSDPLLHVLHRRHTAGQAIRAIETCRRAGFSNISIDLIYGLPEQTEDNWTEDLHTAINLGVEHISAYHLTYEEGTPLDAMRRARQVCEADEDTSLRLYRRLTRTLSAAGYIHYEISNFCRPGFHSRHNSAYWDGTPYLGCGPSAHSFNGHSREWNTSSIEAYISSVEAGKRLHETEEENLPTRYNDFVMTGLRTRSGVSTLEIKTRFGHHLLNYCLDMAAPWLKSEHLVLENGRLHLTPDGVFVSDSILADLMYVD